MAKAKQAASKEKTKTSKTHSKKPIIVLVVLLVLVVAGGVAMMCYNKWSVRNRKICFVTKSGDIGCAANELKEMTTTDLPEVKGKKITRITAAPNNSYYIAAVDNIYRDAPLWLLDKNFAVVRAIKVPVNTYDLLQTVWAKDGSYAVFHSDVGLLYRYDTASGETKQLNQDRGAWEFGETFDQNKRGDIGKLAATPDGTLVFTVNDNNGVPNTEALYAMDAHGNNVRKLADPAWIGNIAVRNNNEVLYSVDKYQGSGDEDLGGCSSEECELYMADVRTGKSQQVTGKGSQFWGFTYDPKTDYVYMVRGPGHSVAEVYSQRVSKLLAGKDSSHIRLADDSWYDPQSEVGLYPMGPNKLAILDQFKKIVTLYDLKTGKPGASMGKPGLQISSDGGGGIGFVPSNWNQPK